MTSLALASWPARKLPVLGPAASCGPTGQIVEQHVELGVEQILPARGEMREQVGLVWERQIVAPVEPMNFRQGKIPAQKISQRSAQTNGDAAATRCPGRAGDRRRGFGTESQRVLLRVGGSRPARKRSKPSSAWRCQKSQQSPQWRGWRSCNRSNSKRTRLVRLGA